MWLVRVHLKTGLIWHIYQPIFICDKTLCVSVLAQRFVSKLRKKSHISRPLSASEIIKAEKLWIAYLQKDQCGDVIKSIQQTKSNNLKIQLGIFIDISGILRCRGRLENAGISESAKQPILLPKHNRYMDLVIAMYHRKALHTGIAQTLSLIRQKYWI